MPATAGITNVCADLVLAGAEGVGTLEEAGAAHLRGVVERVAGQHLRAFEVDAGADHLPHLLRAIGRGRVALRDEYCVASLAGAGGGGAGGLAATGGVGGFGGAGGAAACGFVTAIGRRPPPAGPRRGRPG